MITEDAIAEARSKNLDLVEVSPLAEPPVCKIMDYGQYLYSQKKKEKKQKKAQKQVEVKGVRMSMRTSDHDLETKAKQAIKFLSKKNMVKVQLIMKGRESAHEDIGREKMNQFAEMLKDYGHVDGNLTRHGYQITMIIVPS